MRFLIAALFCACMTTALADKVYRWVDEQGNVHYSQSPPPGMATKPQAVDVTPKPADPAAVQHSQDLQQQLQQDSQQQAQAKAGQDQQSDALKHGMIKSRCDNLKAQLAAYQQQAQSGQAATDANGGRTYVNVANRNRAIQQLQSQIGNQC